MPTSATGSREQAGVTLIELLVGLVVTSVLLGSAMLAFPRTDERRTELAAERIEALIARACERAELGGHDIGIGFGRTRVAFGPFRRGAWQVIADSPAEALRPRALEGGVWLELRVDGRVSALADAVPEMPQLACLATGELTPFVLELHGPGGHRRTLRGAVVGALVGIDADAR